MHEHEEWLLWAEYDLKIARLVLSSEEVIVPPILYHCQQCIEKALKAYLIFQKQQILKTHDLIKLIGLCMQFDVEFNTLTSTAAYLVPHITASRYPDSAFIMPDTTTAQILFTETEAAFNFVKNKMI